MRRKKARVNRAGRLSKFDYFRILYRPRNLSLRTVSYRLCNTFC